MRLFSSVQSLDRLGRRGDMTYDSAKTLCQSFLQKALVSSPGIGRDVHSLMLSIKPLLCWSQCHPSSTMPWRMVLERLLWHVTCLNHSSFCLLTVARRGSCVPARKFILLRNQSLVLCSEGGDVEKVPHALGFESLDTFFFQNQQAGSLFHSHRGGWRWWEICSAWTRLRSWWCLHSYFHVNEHLTKITPLFRPPLPDFLGGPNLFDVHCYKTFFTYVVGENSHILLKMKFHAMYAVGETLHMTFA